ncbi:hypothetical protein PoB_001548900 [Plakobranchus ocellatus]|uniref:Uncharacterized protein n=1 Tax=Plakobranchus ocellatus TaxID=259542 RepID=A0AAV3Z3L2_9GAST|nr:hypothetical protein PoB_001548900 [Plakobranchus ocellatus]
MPPLQTRDRWVHAGPRTGAMAIVSQTPPLRDRENADKIGALQAACLSGGPRQARQGVTDRGMDEPALAERESAVKPCWPGCRAQPDLWRNRNDDIHHMALSPYNIVLEREHKTTGTAGTDGVNDR